MIDTAERGKHLGTVELPVEGTIRTLEFADRSIAVDCNNQRIAQSACFLKIADMACMQEIKAPVG